MRRLVRPPSTRFVDDSPLQGDGFEPSVRGAKEPVSVAEGELRGIERGAPKRVVFYGVPMVRIHFPPGASLQTLGPSRSGLLGTRSRAALLYGINIPTRPRRNHQCAGGLERRIAAFVNALCTQVDMRDLLLITGSVIALGISGAGVAPAANMSDTSGSNPAGCGWHARVFTNLGGPHKGRYSTSSAGTSSPGFLQRADRWGSQ